ncbi:MAG TPA: RecX family transcriptional regulator [Anaerolineales bacterium]|nr:RecX family transcriptional regulator [Anaerolineales bacterium]
MSEAIEGGTITALKVQKRNPQRVNVYLDGEYAFGLARITAGWLSIGQVLSAEKIAQLQAEDGREVAYQQALRLLSYRPRASAEVRRNLVKHDVPAEVIEDVLARLQRAGLIDDNRFAQAWVENRSEFRPRGRRALVVEMRQRGLDDESIQQALAEVDEQALADQAANKQARRLAGLDETAFKQKLSGFLARRGFGYAVIRETVDRHWNQIQNNEG